MTTTLDRHDPKAIEQIERRRKAAADMMFRGDFTICANEVAQPSYAWDNVGDAASLYAKTMFHDGVKFCSEGADMFAPWRRGADLAQIASEIGISLEAMEHLFFAHFERCLGEEIATSYTSEDLVSWLAEQGGRRIELTEFAAKAAEIRDHNLRLAEFNLLER